MARKRLYFKICGSHHLAVGFCSNYSIWSQFFCYQFIPKQFLDEICFMLLWVMNATGTIIIFFFNNKIELDLPSKIHMVLMNVPNFYWIKIEFNRKSLSESVLLSSCINKYKCIKPIDIDLSSATKSESDN